MQPYLARAWHCIEVKNWQLALRELQAIVGEQGQDAQVHYLIGFCLMRLEQYPAAEAAARQALSLQPDWAHLHTLLADVHLLCEQYQAAAQHLERSLQLDATNSDTYRALASLLYAVDDYADALKASETGLAYNADDPQCLLLRANCLRMLQCPQQAKAAYREVLRQNPEHVEAHAMLGWIDFEVERGNQAATHFRTALQQNPNDERARRAYVKILKYGHLFQFRRWTDRHPILGFVLLLTLILIVPLSAMGLSLQWLEDPTLGPMLLVTSGLVAVAVHEIVMLRGRELQFFLNVSDRLQSGLMCGMFGCGILLIVISFAFRSSCFGGILAGLGVNLCIVGLAFDQWLNPQTQRLELAVWGRLAIGLPIALIPLALWSFHYVTTGTEPVLFGPTISELEKNLKALIVMVPLCSALAVLAIRTQLP